MIEVEVVAELPLQFTVAPFTGCPFNVTCPYTEAVGVSADASGVANIARATTAINVLNTILPIFLLSIDSPLIFSSYEWLTLIR
jgi:hypothetical protein